ncbi:hypothetical protein D915_003303 [Fasciola hepatica]|uniref:SH3 domain-containing protein n=1 Tax=Fasciola hepatica TaxID=6192 RepID=A0A4E0RBD0_FASHE|nr:hypothetical protein D915_003303 [Fasciola hepatica]
MSDQLKIWTKELDQLSSEVRKFINSAKVCVKANPLEDDLILKRQNEIGERIKELASKIANEQGKGLSNTNEKAIASLKKLSEKLEGVKTKLSDSTSNLGKGDKSAGDSKKLKNESSKESKSKDDKERKGKELDKKDNKRSKLKPEKEEEKKSKRGTESSGDAKKKETAQTSATDIPSATESTLGKSGFNKKSKNHKEQTKPSESESEQKVKRTKGDKKDKVKTTIKELGETSEGKCESDKIAGRGGKFASSLKLGKQKKDKSQEKPTEDQSEKNNPTLDQAAKPPAVNPEEKLESIATEVSDLVSDADNLSTFHTEEVVSDLEEDSFIADHMDVQNAEVKHQEKPILGILKKSTTKEKPEESQKPAGEITAVSSKPSVIKGTPGELFITIRGWAGEEADDLSFEPGCYLKVLQKNEDGWWLAEGDSGKTGLVPMNFLKPMNFDDESYLKTSKTTGDRKTRVQEAFAEVFHMEDEEETQCKPPGKNNDSTGVKSQNQTEVDAEKRSAVQKERERITREAFAEVFRLEEQAEEKTTKPLVHVGTTAETQDRAPNDTETTDMVASLYDEDTFTLDDLVQENLTVTKEIKVNTEMRSRDPDPSRLSAEQNAADGIHVVSVKERVNQWEEKVTGKRQINDSQSPSITVLNKQNDKNKREKNIDSDANQKENLDGLLDEEGNKTVDQHPRQGGEENHVKDFIEAEEDADDSDEEEESVDETISELSENEYQDEQDDPDRVPVQSASPKKNEALSTAAKWLYQSNAKVLKSLEPLPSSARISTLASLDWTRYNYQTFLVPRLGSSHLMLVDLVYDATERKVVRRPAHIQRIVHIQKCINMPTVEETNFTVQERIVRLCLFDGHKPLSNVVRIPMVTTDREKKIWQPQPQNLLRETKPNDLSAELFVRYNYSDAKVHLLIESGISVLKKSDDQPIELSLGWILVPFYDEKGVIVTNRSNDYLMQPGTPYEERVFSEEPAKEETLRSRVQNLLFGKHPQMTVRIGQPSREQNSKLETLPDILVGLCGYLPIMSLYWEMLGNVLFGSSSTGVKDSVYLRHVPPSCALLPYVADTPLLMEALRVSWNDVFKELPSTQKKDLDKLQKAYSDHFLRVIYPMVCLLNVIPTGPTSTAVFEKKTDLVLSMLRQTQMDPIKFYMSTEHKFLAFTTREFTCPIRIVG